MLSRSGIGDAQYHDGGFWEKLGPHISKYWSYGMFLFCGGRDCLLFLFRFLGGVLARFGAAAPGAFWLGVSRLLETGNLNLPPRTPLTL